LVATIPAVSSLWGTGGGGSTIGAIPDNSTIGFRDAHTLSGLGSDKDIKQNWCDSIGFYLETVR
jgi:hypothetical protein